MLPVASPNFRVILPWIGAANDSDAGAGPASPSSTVGSDGSNLSGRRYAPTSVYCAMPVCTGVRSVSVSETAVKFPFATVKSKDLAKNLGGCKKAVVFCATVGLGIDRLITKYGTVSPVKSLIFEGIGAERIEALCDAFCREFKGARPRFSPGYGDLDIGFQSAIFKVLQCDKKIGVTLNESLLMSPS